MNGGADSNSVVFAPTSARCDVGTLALQAESPSEFEAGAAAALASVGSGGPGSGILPTATAQPAGASARANTTSAAGAAVLSLASGLAPQPGVGNVLAGHGFLPSTTTIPFSGT